MTFTAVACLEPRQDEESDRFDEYFDRPLEQADPMFTRGEVALWLRISVDSLARMRKAGTGPHFVEPKAGMIRYRNSDLQAWVDRRMNCVLPASARPVRGGHLRMAV